jgi:hypothetical protein
VLQIVGQVFGVNAVLVLLACATVLWPGAALAIVALVVGSALVGVLLWRLSRGPR